MYKYMIYRIVWHHDDVAGAAVEHNIWIVYKSMLMYINAWFTELSGTIM